MPYLQMQVDRDDLIRALIDLPRDELIDLVKDLDLEMAEWDFTLPLCKHFAKLLEDYMREEGEGG